MDSKYAIIGLTITSICTRWMEKISFRDKKQSDPLRPTDLDNEIENHERCHSDEEVGCTVADDDDGTQREQETFDKHEERHRQLGVDDVNVLRESVDDSPDRRGVEESHGSTNQLVQHFLV